MSVFKRVHYHPQDGVPIRGVLFDMVSMPRFVLVVSFEPTIALLQDGTLTVPAIDFPGMRKALGLPRPLDVLLEIAKMDASQQEAFA